MSYSGIKQVNTNNTREVVNKENLESFFKNGNSFVYIDKDSFRFLVEKLDGIYITPLTNEARNNSGISYKKKVTREFLEENIYATITL